MGSLGIAIDGGRFIRIDSSINDIPRNIRLRTLKPGQKTAKLDFCVFRKSGPLLRRSVRLDSLPSNSKQVIELKLQVERRSYAIWVIKVRRPDGGAEDFRIRTGIGLWPLFVLMPLLLLAAGWGLFRMAEGYRESRRPGAAIAATEKTPKASVPEKVAAAETTPQGSADPAGDTEDGPVDAPENSADAAGDIPPTGSTQTFPAQSIVYFNPESALLLPGARNQLDILSESMPADLRMEISGHCAFYGTEKGRRDLSEARAEAVASYLKSRIPPTVTLTTVAYGGDRPVSRNLDTQDLNRRAELTVVDE